MPEIDTGEPAENPAPLPVEAPVEHPASVEVISADAARLAKAFRRVEARAPAAVRERVEAALADASALADGAASLEDRLRVAKAIVDLRVELRGQVPFEAQFYQGGRLAIVRVQDPIRIRGAIDHRRIEAFFERYLRRAEEAFARMLYFLKRAGVDVEKEERELAAWEKPYSDLEEYRELIWGRMQKGPTEPPPRRG
jgi:hypothetical protein